jgi:phosphate:Na+ symporter
MNLSGSGMILTVVGGGGGPGGDLQTLVITMELLGGLALFLFGMDQMAEAMKSAAGQRMRSILSALTVNRLMGMLTGTFVTAVIQSSSVTTVLVVGFISAGLMSLSQAIGIILGADIGTTITAQIIAFKVTKYALGMVALGFALLFLGKKERLRQYGAGIMGLGLIFLGMGTMSSAMSPLRTYQPFLDAMARMENPLIGILIATVFTALVQSSSATTGLVIVMSTQGFITLPAGIALVFGANIGTCVTAILAAIGKPREAVRAAVVHVVFKVVGVFLWFFLIDELGQLVTWLSPTAEGLTGNARLAAEAPRQIANAHTIFNVANGLLFLPFTTQFARVVEWMVPDRPLEEEVVRAKYLDLELLSTPSLALDRVRLEILRLGDRVKAMFQAILPAVFDGDQEDLTGIALMDDSVDVLHGKIIAYLGQISRLKLGEQETQELIKLMETANDLENIGDIIETNLVALGSRRLSEQVSVSADTRREIEDFHRAVERAFDAAMLAVTQKNEEAARVVIAMKAEINELTSAALVHHAERLTAEEPKRLPAYAIETNVIENLKRVYYFCKRMARGLVPSEVTRSS